MAAQPTLIDFAYWFDEHRSALDAIEARDKNFVGNSYCDWAYHLMLHSEPLHTFTDQLAEAIQAGYPTLKIFTTNILPGRTGRMIDFGDIWEAFQVLAAEGGLGVIHAEDNDIVMHMYDKLIREDRTGFENLARGSQFIIGRHQLSPRPSPGRKRSRNRALHDARQCGDRRARHR